MHCSLARKRQSNSLQSNEARHGTDCKMAYQRDQAFQTYHRVKHCTKTGGDSKAFHKRVRPSSADRCVRTAGNSKATDHDHQTNAPCKDSDESTMVAAHHAGRGRNAFTCLPAHCTSPAQHGTDATEMTDLRPRLRRTLKRLPMQGAG